MALILNIDTAIETASICLSNDGEVLGIVKNEKQKDHAAWIHVAIKVLFDKSGFPLSSMDAIAITGGPGSYTGLRIGMAAAKGICYALNKPLICLNTLEVMANAAKTQEADLLCPMIDARRMEVFTAVYTKDGRMIKEPAALTLHENSFDEELLQYTICFFGNGSLKFSKIKKHENALFREIEMDAASMITLAEQRFARKEFADLAYAEPLYLKEFYPPAK